MGYGILSYGAYVPPIRLKRESVLEAVGWAVPGIRGLAAGERSVASWDEDSVTMAVEAARNCLIDCSEIPSSITLASTTFPFADRSNSGIVADALNLPLNTLTEDAFGSRRSGTSALVKNFLGSTNTLLLASECREAKPGSTQEMTYGHGAAALLLGEGNTIADILSVESVHEDLIDQYRTVDTKYDYSLEERWVREEGWLKIVPDAINLALSKAEIGIGDVDKVVVQGSAGAARSLSKKMGIDGGKLADPLQATIGDCGAAHPLLMLTQVLAESNPNEIIMIVGFGQGTDIILLKTKSKISQKNTKKGLQIHLDNKRQIDNYTLYLSLRGHIDIDFGLRSERDNRTALSAYYRKRREISAMLGGRCQKCGTLQFPRSLICVSCGSEEPQVEESLSGLIGRVKSFTEDWLAYTPFPPYIYGNVEFEGGANMMLEFTDFKVGDVKVGNEVRMVFRVKDYDDKRKFRRYFWKPAPLLTDAR